ncbi:F-box/kelch-repeat protein [Abeliophyllum distichum]|uniref:F-box/kelch-repeat protein n=1 Tax=Abeliophyllum distichum TaxID=126358 RepID=A0ABD1Q293_9LAMI
MESRRDSPDSPIQEQSKKTRYSYDPIHTLPSEIIVEILSRLPVKSLLKFRCVSKSWLSLISSPQLIKTHLKVSTNDPNFTSHRIMFTTAYPRFNLKNCTLRSLLYEPLTDAVSISYPRRHPRRSVWVVGSCNGLICIAINEKDLFLWNPSVRKSKKLPNVDVPMGRGFYIVYGFGFDETNEDYKVVGIFCSFGNAGGYETLVKIYSLKTNSWRRIEDFNGGVPLDDSGTFVHGKLHWSASPGVGFSSGWDIVSLDVEREIYGMVEQPNYGEGGFASLLGVLGGSVCVICDYQKTRADVWVLKEYGIKESWTKVVTIPYINEPGRYMYSIPLCILRNGEVLLALGSSYVVYNPKENSFRFPKISNVDDFLEANTYIESLVSPAAVMVDQE